MSFANHTVGAVLLSPFHRLLSGSTDLIRYVGARSGRTFTTPTQYASDGADLLILVGKPKTKTWWKSFRSARDLDVRLKGRWVPMVAEAIVGSEQPEAITAPLASYLERFPRASASLGAGSRREQADSAVIVRCRPR
jgi:hypothetical protein